MAPVKKNSILGASDMDLELISVGLVSRVEARDEGCKARGAGICTSDTRTLLN